MAALGQQPAAAPAALPPANDSQAEVAAANALLSLLPPTGGAPVDPGAVFTPGTIVWAKVEGHDWWPAQVVRRRAVPRGDVEPPPGGATNIMNYYPVVFFNQTGVPSEIHDTLDSPTGALAASLRAHKAAAVNEEVEAEYGWLQATNLRKFEAGSYDFAAAQVAANEELAACVRAAEAALAAQARDGNNNQEAANGAPEYDSDGGWGHAQRAQPDPSPAVGRRPPRGRGRGAKTNLGRRVRSRRNTTAGNAGGGDEDGAGGVAFSSQQIVVDAILGWRYPLSKSEKAAAARAEHEAHASKIQQLHDLHAEIGEPGATEVKAVESVVPPASEAAEAALLLDFQTAASQEADDGGGAHATREREFLIKWHDISHARNEWVSESRVMALAKRKLLNFTKKYGAEPVDLSNENWTVPERFVARRKCPFGPGWDILVKWTGAPCVAVLSTT